MNNHTDRQKPAPDNGFAELIAVLFVVVLTVAVSGSIVVTLPEALDSATQPRCDWANAGRYEQ